MLNFDAVSEICAKTESEICPFNLSIFKPVTGWITTSSFNKIPSLDKVVGPATPSGVIPFLVCHSLRVFSVFGPKSPSATRPNFSCNNLTSLPFIPSFNIS